LNNDDASCPSSSAIWRISPVLHGIQIPTEDTDGWMKLITALSSFLKQLNPSDIELITLYAYDGYTVTEIAQLLSVTQPTISKKITRIEKYLKKFEEEATD
jgi:RNA polymerase sigma factor (sigma-70 family)